MRPDSHRVRGPVPAALSRRLVARLADFAVLAAVGGLVGPVEFDHHLSGADRWLLALAGLGAAVVWESVFVCVWGGTPGKHLLGLWVVDVNGARPAVGRSLLRAVLLFGLLYLPIVGQLAVLVLFVAAAAHDHRRTWWDRACGTQVVAIRRPRARAMIRMAEGMANDPNIGPASRRPR